MDIFVQYAVAIAALIGFVNGLRLLQDKNYWGFLYFALAVVAGGVFGYMHWFSLPSVEVGVLVGLGSSGFYRLQQVRGSAA